jgi:hypothetical protein
VADFRTELHKNNPLSGGGRDIGVGRDLPIMHSPTGRNAQRLSR